MGLGSQIREKSVSRIAIIGSCITRDLWPILGETPRDLLYVARTSLPSLFSRPLHDVAIDGDRITQDNPIPSPVSVEDLGRT